jgi:nitrite reductase (NO-forming)
MSQQTGRVRRPDQSHLSHRLRTRTPRSAIHQQPSRPGPANQPHKTPLSKANSSQKAKASAPQRTTPAPQGSSPQEPTQAPSPADATSQPSRGQTSQAQSKPAEPQTSAQSPAPKVDHAHTAGAQATADHSQGDVAAGRQVYRKCQACHSLDPGKNLVGPSLREIIGRKAGAEQGFNYSPAMKSANITWDVKTLDDYLADPQKVIPGNRMPFPGLESQTDRKDVIAFLAGSAGPTAAGNVQARAAAPLQNQPGTGNQQQAVPAIPHAMPDMPDVKYTVRSGIADGRMVFIGVGSTIDGKINPVLSAALGQIVQITLINGEGAEHDIVFPDQNAKSARVTGRGASTTIAFQATKSGDFLYYCSVPGHQLAGMQGQFIVTPRPPAQAVAEADISRDPADLPPPIAKREPQTSWITPWRASSAD